MTTPSRSLAILLASFVAGASVCSGAVADTGTTDAEILRRIDMLQQQLDQLKASISHRPPPPVADGPPAAAAAVSAGMRYTF